MRRLFVQIIIALFLFSSVHAEIFKWVDDKGTVHFTEDPATIPESYRDRAKGRLTEEDLMSDEERAISKQKSEGETKERIRRENNAYERSLREEQLQKTRREREYIQYGKKIRAGDEEKTLSPKEATQESKPEYAQISCNYCNGSGIIWKKVKSPKIVGGRVYGSTESQIATKCEHCNGKGFTLKRTR